MHWRRWPFLWLAVVLVISGCSLGGGGGSGGSGQTETPPSNALTVRIAYSPEKEGWLTDRIKAFNAQQVKVGNQTVFVEGVVESSGAARTKIKNGQLNVTVWSPSASTWLEVLKLESGNQNIAVSNKPLVLT